MKLYDDSCPGPVNKKDRGLGKILRMRPHESDHKRKASATNNFLHGGFHNWCMRFFYSIESLRNISKIICFQKTKHFIYFSAERDRRQAEEKDSEGNDIGKYIQHVYIFWLVSISKI